MSSRTFDEVSSASSPGERGPDEEAVRQAKAEIQSLISEIDSLSRTEVEPTDFYAALLEKSISALAAIGGVVWTFEPGTGFKLEYQVNLQQTGLLESPEAMNQHGKMLGQLVQRGEPALVPPRSGAGLGDDSETAANPTQFLLVTAPIVTDRGVDGLVEIFQRTGARPNTQRGYLRFLAQICDYAGAYLKTRRLRDFGAKQTLWEQLEGFTSLVHGKLESRSTAFTIANEGRRLIGCDRVTVVLKHGPKYVVEAISGQDTFDKRSNVVRMLRQLATVVVKSGEDLWYQGDTTNLSPQVEKAVNAYVDESHTKRLAVLPLREADPHADDPNRPKRRENMLGAIVIEQLVDSRAPDGLMQRVDVVRRHSSTALTNAQSHEHLFLLPLWRLIGKSRVMFAARNLPKTILAAIVLGALIAVMWLMPWDFTVTADGKLRPDIRSYVFAAGNGIIDEVLVRDGDTVAAGDVVARQTSLDVQDELLELDGELKKTGADIGTKEAKLRNYDQRRSQQDVTPAELQDEINQLKGYRDNLLKRRELIVKKTKLLDIASPISGKVVTWKVHDLLLNRPVSTGTRLMEIADPTQEWELQIDVPEAKMGHVQRELGILRKTDPGAQLEVTFILATHPGDRLVGKVTRVDESAQVSGEDGNTVRMDVSFDQGELLKLIESDDEQKGDKQAAAATPRQLTPEEQQQIAELKLNLKVGADVKAKIHCGRAAVGYVLFHDLWEFIQSRILFRF